MPKCDSSSTWTSAARRTGRCRACSRRREMLERARSALRQPITPIVEAIVRACAIAIALPDGKVFGIIASTTEPFCSDLRSQPADRRRDVVPVPVRRAWNRPAASVAYRRISDEQLAQLIRATWEVRSDRGAEERLATRDRSPLIPIDRLRAGPASRNAHARWIRALENVISDSTEWQTASRPHPVCIRISHS